MQPCDAPTCAAQRRGTEEGGLLGRRLGGRALAAVPRWGLETFAAAIYSGIYTGIWDLRCSELGTTCIPKMNPKARDLIYQIHKMDVNLLTFEGVNTLKYNKISNKLI